MPPPWAVCAWLGLCCCQQISPCLGCVRGCSCAEDYSPYGVIPLRSCVTPLFEQCPTVVPWEATVCQNLASRGCFCLCWVAASPRRGELSPGLTVPGLLRSSLALLLLGEASVLKVLGLLCVWRCFGSLGALCPMSLLAEDAPETTLRWNQVG